MNFVAVIGILHDVEPNDYLITHKYIDLKVEKDLPSDDEIKTNDGYLLVRVYIERSFYNEHKSELVRGCILGVKGYLDECGRVKCTRVQIF